LSFIWDTAGWGEGLYNVSAVAGPVPGELNAANNVKYAMTGSTPSHVNLVLEFASLNIISPVNGSYIRSQNVTVSWVYLGNVDLDFFNVTVNSGSWIRIGTVTNYTFSFLPEGLHIVKVYAVNKIGKGTESNVTFITDIIPPVISINCPSADGIVHVGSGGYIWVNGSVTEANKGSNQPAISDSRFALALWDYASGEFSFYNNTAISDGSLEILVHFTDLAGNEGSRTVNFTVKNQVPPPSGTPDYTIYIIITIVAVAIAALLVIRKIFRHKKLKNVD
jgi:hypothetical protein